MNIKIDLTDKPDNGTFVSSFKFIMKLGVTSVIILKLDAEESHPYMTHTIQPLTLSYFLNSFHVICQPTSQTFLNISH